MDPIKFNFHNQIKENLESNKSLPELIDEKKIYFRVSVTSRCNLACSFCHNEGQNENCKDIDYDFGLEMIKAANKIGFNRIQFTGGEPLLHPKIIDFIIKSKDYFSNVGITTNGTLLRDNLDSLLHSKISRIHISPQLNEKGDICFLDLRSFKNTIYTLTENDIKVKINIPVTDLEQALNTLDLLIDLPCDICLFRILPFYLKTQTSLTNQLEIVAQQMNNKKLGKVKIRGFYVPHGIRCKYCSAFSICSEESRSLRLGADGILRPCLASRYWDVEATTDIDLAIKQATLFALDF